jgi:hypothetical protein
VCVAAGGGDPVADDGEPRAVAGDDGVEADAVATDFEAQDGGAAVELDGDPAGTAVADRVLDRFDTAEVGGALVLSSMRIVTRIGRPPGVGAQAVAKPYWSSSGGARPQARSRIVLTVVSTSRARSSSSPARLGSRGVPRVGGADPRAERDQPALGAIVDVALGAAAAAVMGLSACWPGWPAWLAQMLQYSYTPHAAWCC